MLATYCKKNRDMISLRLVNVNDNCNWPVFLRNQTKYWIADRINSIYKNAPISKTLTWHVRAGLVRGNAFLEEGKEYVYQEWGIQNAGTMDYSPSAAGISWRSSVRIQVSPSLHTVQCTVVYTLDCTTHQQQGYLGGHPFAFRSAIEEGYRQ